MSPTTIAPICREEREREREGNKCVMREDDDDDDDDIPRLCVSLAVFSFLFLARLSVKKLFLLLCSKVHSFSLFRYVYAVNQSFRLYTHTLTHTHTHAIIIIQCFVQRVKTSLDKFNYTAVHLNNLTNSISDSQYPVFFF
jgi:hypothetical protein